MQATNIVHSFTKSCMVRDCAVVIDYKLLMDVCDGIGEYIDRFIYLGCTYAQCTLLAGRQHSQSIASLHMMISSDCKDTLEWVHNNAQVNHLHRYNSHMLMQNERFWSSRPFVRGSC